MKYKWNPKEFDIGGAEKFYSDLSARGWNLTKRGALFSQFEKAEPESVKYRIEIVSPKLLKAGKLPDEQIGIYEDCGWEYVTGNNFHHIFRTSTDSDAPEFYLEPEQQAETLKDLQKRYLWSALSPLFYILLFTVLSFFTWNVSDGHWQSAFYQSWIADTYLIIGYGLLLLGLVIGDVWGTVYLSRLCRKLKKGIPMDHQSKGKHSVLNISQWTMILVGILCLGWDMLGAQKAPLPEKTEEPYLLMSEIGISEPRTQNYLYHDEESQVICKNSLLAKSWNTREFIENNQWLYQEVYQLKNPNSIDNLVEVLMYNSTFAKSPSNFKRVEIPGLDQAWIGNDLECIAVKNDKAAVLTHIWKSPEDMENTLHSLAQKWKE